MPHLTCASSLPVCLSRRFATCRIPLRATVWSRRGRVSSIRLHFLPMVCPEAFAGQIEIRETADLSGAPEEIRTPDPQIRSLVLYP
jgi:hypothetical protein